jgi:hypothetical protein|nr:MXAN_5187 family protein [Kofleriaceae bacterium]
MFLSKIWFFLVALAALAFGTFALVMPRPAQREAAYEAHRRLVLGCNTVGIRLADAARKHVDLVATFVRDDRIIDAVASTSAADKVDDEHNKKAHVAGEAMMKAITADPPAFAMLIDARGRVVARVGFEDGDYGDTAAGRPLVDQALAGYLADDLWILGKNQLYFVTASPVIKRTSDFAYTGAVVLGYKASKELAAKLVIHDADEAEQTEVGFFVGPDSLATSKTVAFDTGALVDDIKGLPDKDRDNDCTNGHLIAMRSGTDDYDLLGARLPGEAGDRGAYYAVYTSSPDVSGFGGTVKKVDKGDLSFGNFPWLLVGGGFIVALGVGILLMIVEADKPLRVLVADTVRLAKGDADRLDENRHRGKFGSIARSVNIHIDKLGREAKSAKKDLDQLLGPAPEGSLGTIDLLATALPASRPGGAPSMGSPPPSEFRFGGDAPGMSAMPPAPMPMSAPPMMAPSAPPPRPQMPRPATPPPPPAQNLQAPGPQFGRPPTPLPMPPALQQGFGAGAPPMRLDDDILGAPGGSSGPIPTTGAIAVQAGTPDAATAAGGEGSYFQQVFEQFLAVKRSCNEPTTGLTYQKFSDKLVKNRDDLKAKTGCREVRFTVYVKDGKAALKATPVKDE